MLQRTSLDSRNIIHLFFLVLGSAVACTEVDLCPPPFSYLAIFLPRAQTLPNSQIYAQLGIHTNSWTKRFTRRYSMLKLQQRNLNFQQTFFGFLSQPRSAPLLFLPSLLQKRSNKQTKKPSHKNFIRLYHSKILPVQRASRQYFGTVFQGGTSFVRYIYSRSWTRSWLPLLDLYFSYCI